MSAWLDQTEEEQTMQIRRAVKQTKMPEVSYVNQIMERVENMDRRSRKSIHRKGGWVKKTAISVSAAAVLGGVVLGSGFVSPAMADALKNVPLIGSVFQYNFDPTLKQASISGLTTEPNLSVTRDGLTLNIKEVMYDGTRLAFMIERQGMDDDTVLSPYLPEGATNVSGETQKKVPVEQQKKGYLFMPEVTIQGKSGFFGSFTDAVGKTEDGKFIRNMAMYEITSGLSDKQLPNEFNMTVKMNVSGFKEPFVFQVPVKNLAKGNVVLHPNQTQSSGAFSYTVKTIEITPVTTRLVLDSQGSVPSTPEQSGEFSATKMYYDIVDQDGKALDQKMIGYFHQNPKTEYHEDETYSPFAKKPTSITIKPYTMTVNKDWSVVEDANGKPVKTYHKDLEMTIPVQ
ncbi:MAG TPA: DUF4179 domain-containing protein [Paenibacillus cookii]|nr:DUF4179 domain-containing protein [Paenibacillus cookii]